jgi:hypothetical protein
MDEISYLDSGVLFPVLYLSSGPSASTPLVHEDLAPHSEHDMPIAVPEEKNE